MRSIRRRDLLKCAAGGAAAIVVGNSMPWMLENEAIAAPAQSLDFTITDAIKDMATNNDINAAQCYFWIYKEATMPADCPGPMIFVREGDFIRIKITNALDEPHSLLIPGIFNSGPIAPGATVSKSFRPNKTGTFLYYDNLNAPVNRVMGLHGTMVVMPAAAAPGAKFTPYNNPTPAVQNLFNDLGAAAWWPGLAWEAADPASNTPPFRQYIWLLHQASPNLFAEVGNFAAGQDYPSAQFVQKFLKDRFNPAAPDRTNNVPQYFTISGQSGHFSHNNPYICPNNRVGEPVLIRILNAGLWVHSMHIHANHVFVVSIDGVPQANPLWVDVFTLKPMNRVDWLVPYMRPPDVPNVAGHGRADTPRTSNNGQPVWPPTEEMNYFIPNNLFAGAIDLSVQLSPLCYPMHDHSEPSQTSQGGNYNMGLISGLNFCGDRNIGAAPGVGFPNEPVQKGPGPNGLFPPTVQA
ncbi:MAG: multicopper oxidase domain-containing protein [Syntrophobacteraceae bacterium]